MKSKYFLDNFDSSLWQQSCEYAPIEKILFYTEYPLHVFVDGDLLNTLLKESIC